MWSALEFFWPPLLKIRADAGNWTYLALRFRSLANFLPMALQQQIGSLPHFKFLGEQRCHRFLCGAVTRAVVLVLAPEQDALRHARAGGRYGRYRSQSREQEDFVRAGAANDGKFFERLFHKPNPFSSAFRFILP